MKLNCGPSAEERDRQARRKAREYWCNWHRWFAWFPVRIGENDCRWLEYVDRQAGGVMEGQIFRYVPYGLTYRSSTQPTTN